MTSLVSAAGTAPRYLSHTDKSPLIRLTTLEAVPSIVTRALLSCPVAIHRPEPWSADTFCLVTPWRKEAVFFLVLTRIAVANRATQSRLRLRRLLQSRAAEKPPDWSNSTGQRWYV